MAKGILTELKDEDILRIARARVTESAVATFTQTELDTQLSIERGVIWLIHFVEFGWEDPQALREVAQNSVETIKGQVTRTSEGGILALSDVNLVQRADLVLTRAATIGTDAGPLSYLTESPRRFDFPIPIPFAGESIFLGILGSSASQAHQVDFRIGYTIRAVSDKFFFRVAQSLLG